MGHGLRDDGPYGTHHLRLSLRSLLSRTQHTSHGETDCIQQDILPAHCQILHLRPAAALDMEVKRYVNASLEHLGLCSLGSCTDGAPKCLRLALYWHAPFTAELLILLQTSWSMGHKWQSCQRWQFFMKLGVLLKSQLQKSRDYITVPVYHY